MVATLRRPNLARAFLFVLLGAAFSFGLSVLIRALYGHDNYAHFIDANSVLLIGMIACPFVFLVGLGAFEYWFYWASGNSTRTEDDSVQVAHSWKVYLRINSDHKAIGIWL